MILGKYVALGLCASSISGAAIVTTPEQAELKTVNDKALDDCKDSLVDGGKYEIYDNVKFTCRHGKNYLTAFDLTNRLPMFSAYHITEPEAEHEHGGRRSFKQDPDIPEDSQPAVKSPCWGEEWNRGHLCPSYIMSYDKSEDGPWSDTYYITNTAMQAGHFNQGPWAHVEMAVADWIRDNKKTVYVVTGTIINNHDSPDVTCDLSTGDISTSSSSTKTSSVLASWKQWAGNQFSSSVTAGTAVGIMGYAQSGKMAVADYYYKILCDPEGGKSIAYLGKNTQDMKTIEEKSVDDVHEMLGKSIFPSDKCGTSSFSTDYWFDITTYAAAKEKEAALVEEKKFSQEVQTSEEAAEIVMVV